MSLLALLQSASTRQVLKTHLFYLFELPQKYRALKINNQKIQMSFILKNPC